MLSAERLEAWRVRVGAVVEAAVAEACQERGRAVPAAGEDVELYGGPGALLDSMGLVALIADVEARVAAETGVDVVLADERALSRSRSPFRSVSVLREHVVSVLVEAGVSGA